VQRLDRIHDDDGRAGGINLLEHDLGAGLRQDQHASVVETEPVGAQPHLLRRLLAGDVQDGEALPRERAARLERQRRLADPGISAHQRDRSGDDPTTEHAVELTDAGRPAKRALGLDRRQRTWDGRARRSRF
jgi:hypothetical protein